MYAVELDASEGKVEELLTEIQAATVTYLYASKESKLNNAVALKEYIEPLIGTELV